MDKLRIVKSIVVFMLILVVIIVPVSKNQFKKIEIPSPSSKEFVFKEIKPNEEMKVAIPTHGGLEDQINSVLKDARLQGTTTSISIRRAADGKILYTNLGDTRVHPASLMKLFTGVAALETLGLEHTFKTELYTDGKIKDGELQGNLYLKGLGDPTLTKDDLIMFTTELKEKGIQTVAGNLFGDDTWYDDDRLSQDLNWSDEPYYSGAQVSALTLSPNDDFDAGTVIVDVYPAAKSGEAGTIRMVPENSYVKIVNKTKTVAQNGTSYIKASRMHGSNTVIVSGTVPLGLKQNRSWASVWEPTNYTMNVFKHVLDEQGIEFTNVTQVGTGTVPSGATLLATKQSIPLKKLLTPFMKLSNNGHGEVLVKEIGRVSSGEGSWSKGLGGMNQTLADIGIDMNTMLLRDGSGMSHKTLVTANEVTNLLYIAGTKSWYEDFVNSLPVAGKEERFVGGTLRYRMNGTAAEGKVKAKTGTLNGVTSLAGYAETKDGETLLFSAIINNHLDDTAYGLLDEIAMIIANYKREK
ncbi:D-alanyl-D-alanine carboxypeptidase/D-alanyl-D-alanine-endopeptidase [Sporosarcina sp. Marseille-Q4063]|uniref:D-alanyl-D-alanine carboxypeptidase/D-alanyl-D-alanine endopeptidase n=1 Tax=Sporosarcina sp. Marseille-Q4063 TaxID=2810514 RepID=UPI001BAFB90E|nr:D-alanyl-D-alanine carboxypeptidase/D-alanyl-D-alanine-endopeptidase [Sporosarcina sp. Marseille-Q4063]QUW20584.1 D-alanyl-D-alanine carboxypeptidase/D-alanyl-D-alanine-endopeptidase [Sporosarcina sp. Marseille-Q4063]